MKIARLIHCDTRFMFDCNCAIDRLSELFFEQFFYFYYYSLNIHIYEQTMFLFFFVSTFFTACFFFLFNLQHYFIIDKSLKLLTKNTDRNESSTTGALIEQGEEIR